MFEGQNRPARRAEEDDIENSQELLAQDVEALRHCYQEIGFDVPVAETVEKHSLIWIDGKDSAQSKYFQRSKTLQVPVGERASAAHPRRHEIVHATSRTVSATDKKLEDNYGRRKSRTADKTGVSTFYSIGDSMFGYDKRVTFFEALNEGITDEITMRAGLGLRKGFLHKLALTLASTRSRERKFLAHIIRAMASAEGTTANDVFKGFVGVSLHGWNKDIKSRLINVFGKEALKILSVVGAQSKDRSLYDRKYAKLVYTYFDLTQPAEKRAQAAREVLDKNEYLIGPRARSTMHRSE